ncbi:MAG: polysaccharide biosynthesis tyrosine autokinase [Oscillatoria princeps RMCB-10]|jgi:capsular exopolysaccharide synthesis family protein|nr:polysaccharide biosynthesis tyrosine autokinase [Oscillatoria princeps RMCB-10]
MDTDYQFQPIASKRNGQPPRSLPPLSPPAAEESDQQTLDMAWLFAVVRRRALVMAGVAIAMSVIAGSVIVLKSKQIVRVYEGAFRVLVEPVTAEGRLARLYLQAQSANEGVADLSKIGSSVEETSLVDYQTQIRVLKSPEILEPLVEKLKAQYPDISSKSLGSALMISRVNYERDGKQAGTKLLDVRYQDEDPKKIKWVLERVAEYYLNYITQERLITINQGIKFIDSQLPKLQERVDQLQGELQRLRQQSRLTLPEITSRSQADQVSSIQTRRIDVQAQIAEARQFYENAKQQLDSGNIMALLTLNPKINDTLISQLNGVEAQIAVDSAHFREDSPPMQTLREKQQNLRLLLQREAEKAVENIADQVQQLEAREKSLAQKEDTLNQQITQFPTVLRQYGDLDRELSVATESLKLFLEKREALQLGAAQQQVNWQIVAKPDIIRDETGQPMSITVKQTSRQLAIAVILCTLLGIGVGFLVEVLNTVFHTPEEVKGATKLPLLGVIPLAKGLQKIAPAPVPEAADVAPPSGRTLVLGKVRKPVQYTSSPALEAFRSLYTNIRLISPQAPVRSLAISSAAPGDGKSTVAIHLAQTAAAIGQRVLLVDADLRRPQLHTRLGIPNVRGLSDVIVSDIGLNDVIQRSHSVWSEELPGEDNLFVLTAGPIPNDPIKLLSSKKMLYLMEQFQAFFDLVIYDTPPLAGLSDGNILAAHTDGMVMVVGLDKTDRSMVDKALDGLKISGASVLGVVANGAKG